MRRIRFLTIPFLILAAIGANADSRMETRSIANPLGLDWPWELVHFDLTGETASGDTSVKIGDEMRPTQLETAPDGKTRQLWFIATVKGGADAAARGSTEVSIIPGKTASPLSMAAEQGQIVVHNGVYDFRVPDFEKFSGPMRLDEMPGILGGIKRGGDPDFHGSSSWKGDAQVTSAKTEVTASGPVFIDIKITLAFAPSAGGQGAAQTEENFDKAAPPDSSAAPKNSYEAVLHFVAGDPWVDVTERYNMPAPVQYTLELKDHLNADTVMFIPWFNYMAFGGNNEMQFTKPEPRPKQHGPFLAMRPKWSQMPGGGMDFFLTRGGAPPSDQTPNPGYDANATAVGIVATNPIKWFNPYAQTIGVNCENGDTAHLKFPVGNGARAYAVVCGSRGSFDSTAKLNALVRRHTDWTLDNQINKYVLEWPRKPELAGPHILITRDELRQLQDEYKSDAHTPGMDILKQYIPKKATLSNDDQNLLALIMGDAPPKPAPIPDAQPWLSVRYQDDTLNPTTPATRHLKFHLASSDLVCGGKPIGGPAQAALGYIVTDPNNWPGYANGWGPGNPNFHTDKYMSAMYIAATIPDHPDAKKWLAFGYRNFVDDCKKVLLPPDGVGYECPGYSGYSLALLTEIAKVLNNTGYVNPIAANPLFTKSLVWHRNLLTPFDVRLGLRHEAPIGDTHRWTSGAGLAFGTIAKFIEKTDPVHASEFMGIWNLERAQGMQGSLISDLVDVDQTIPAMALDKMEWGSHAYFGFGSIMRSRFGTPRETFVTLKAGPARGHYHNDELSYHFYGEGTPLSLNYNCSYHPRGDHQALSNSMTFGNIGPFTYPGDSKPVDAMEQMDATARVGAFHSTPVADITVAEATSDTLTFSPIYPEDARFQYNYPSRKTAVPITHRRYLGLVKHPANSKLADYLVVRDETRSADAQELNIHLLARDVQRDGQIIRATGQWDTDAVIFLANPKVKRFDVGRWYYYDEEMAGPGASPGGNTAADKAAEAAERQAWQEKIKQTDGHALIPPIGWKDKWEYGEYQKWLKIGTDPGTPMLWVLYPKKTGTTEPKFDTLAGGGGVRVSLGGETDEVYISTAPAPGIDGQAVVKENGTETVLLKPGAVPPIGEIATPAPTQLAGRVIDDSAPQKPGK